MKTPVIREPQDRIGVNDRVSVPDGRVGSVIGFYCRAPDTLLVLFDSGDSREYAPADLERLSMAAFEFRRPR
jgi:hypothetical protein